MKNTPIYDFSAGYSDKLEDLDFDDKYLDENFVPNKEMPKEWITTGAEDQIKH